MLAPRLDPAANEPTSFLPAWMPYEQGVAALRRHFPNATGLSDAAIVFERADGKLTGEDLAAVEAVAGAIAKPASPADATILAGATVRSPASIPLPASPLKSRDGLAALVVVSVPANFITLRSSRMVDAIRDTLAGAKLPAGLAASVTGSSGFGHDYAVASERSSDSTLLVTVIAVIVILLLVYRSPLAALVPLAAISVAALTAMKLLAVGQHLGMHVGAAEKIFVGVLIYGAGTDYSLLFVSRYREMLAAGADGAAAVAGALRATAGAILAAAGINIAGMLMLCFADYGVFRTAGPAIAVALAVALAAALTLVPALVALLERRVFWPGRNMGQLGGQRLWPAVARAVTLRPAAVLIVAAGALALPAVNCLGLTWLYDSLAELPPASPGGVGNAAVGLQAVKRHWPVGQISPVTVVFEADGPQPAEKWHSAAKAAAAAVAAVPGVSDVRSLDCPLGRKADFVSRAVLAAAAGRIAPEYLAADGAAMRLQAVLGCPALAREALAAARAIAPAADAAAKSAGLHARVHVLGATAEMQDIRIVTQADFRHVAVLVLGAIFAMVFVLLRDAVLAAFMTAATLAGYFATLGLAAAIFALAGQVGLDWKVEVFLFVVMVAVGVDYSIFLAARVRQEAAAAPPRQAVANALIHTGPVISSCGVIMAATLGSLMAGELKLLVQLGAAFALGMMIDTFLVRPLLLPAFMALTRRTGRP
jgi:RND superfamily putative drug exporter